MDIITDDNNNTSNEKPYSLRPRANSKIDKECSDEDDYTTPLVRSRKKQKQKAAPLSKYRRKTANARERSRMREINDAFEALRKSIPHLGSCSDDSNEKTSKIMTLRLAMKYITALSNTLENPNCYSLDFQTTLSLMDVSSSASPEPEQDICSHFITSSPPPLESSSSVGSSLSLETGNYTSASNPESYDFFFPVVAGQDAHPPQKKMPDSFITTSNPSTTSGYHHCHQELVQDSRPRHNRLTPVLSDESLPILPNIVNNSLSSGNIFRSPPTIFGTDYIDYPSPLMDFGDMFIT